MFEFFGGLIENLGIKLISDFGNKLYDWIKEIKNNAQGENNSSGDYAQIGSSGYSAQIGSSGDYAKIGSSGDSAQIGSSGYYAKIGSSGDYAKIGSSGNSAKIDISGANSIGFACGYNSIVKAKKGTWISLAEYGKNEEGRIIPIFAKSAQIGNKDYKDCNGRTLKANTFYILWEKEFYPVDNFDDVWTIRLTEKKRDNITIIKAVDIDDILDKEIKEIYIAKEGKLSAHGYTLREAVDDLMLKKLDNVNISEIVSKIKETGKVTRSQYRAITGACSFGTNKFCEQHNIQNLEEIELSELRKILINDYGAEKFWKLIDQED